MYTSNDLERLFFRYRAEAVPVGKSIQSFCERNKVSFNLFNKWYKDTRQKIVPVQVINVLEGSAKEDTSQSPAAHIAQAEVRILLDIHKSNGMHICQGNLSYEKLRRLVENLKVLC